MTTPTNDSQMIELARHPGVVAVVGFSPDPSRDSHNIAANLIADGVRTYLINPVAAGQTALGQTILATLADVPEHIHIVDVFRRGEFVPAIVEEAIAVKADALWLQLGVFNDDAVARARSAGMQVVVNHCIKVERNRYAHAE